MKTLHLAALAIGLLALAACSPGASEAPATPATAAPAVSFVIPTDDGLAGEEIVPPLQLTDFTLPASTGGDLSLSEITGSGQWTMLYFGYLNCPDFCPLTLAEFKQIKELLGDQADQVAFLFVSVDGERDTPEAVTEYIERFDHEFIAFSGDDATLAQIQQDYGLFYQRVENAASPENYMVDHSTRSYLIDPEGNLRSTFIYNTTPTEIAGAIQWWMARDEA